MKKLALVLRVSRLDGREGQRFQSPKDQEREGRRLAERLGYGVQVFDADARRDTPGSTPFDERPGMGEALRLVEQGKLAGVIVSALDRLVREDAERGVTLRGFQKRVRAARAVLIVADSPDACVEDPDAEELEGYASIGLKARLMFDATLREEARKRWRKARRNAVENGTPVTKPPLGYQREVIGRDKQGLPILGGFVPDPETAPVIRAAFEARANGASWRETARILEEGTAKPRPVKSLVKMLSNRAYLGELRSGPTAVNLSAHEPLIDDALFRRVQATRVKGKRAPRVKPGLLSGIVRCATCGNRMVQDFNISRGGKRVEFYRCNSIGSCSAPAAINKGRVEPYVAGQIVDHYLGVFSRGETPEDRTAEYEARVRAAQEAQGEVEALRGSVTPAAWAKALSAAEEQLDAAREELAAYTPTAEAPPVAILKSLRETAERDNDEALTMLRDLAQRSIESVNVSKSKARRGTRVPVEERVVIAWRDEGPPLTPEQVAAS